MNHPRTLPIRVDPIPGEALDSWLEALAFRLHTPLADLLPELGLRRRPHRRTSEFVDVPLDWTVLLRASELDALSSATGVDSRSIEALTLSRYDGRALLVDSATRQVNRRRLWGRSRGSRYCPDCLADTGGRWLLSWRVGWSFACTTHRRLLADVCPGCDRVARRRLLRELPILGRCVQPTGVKTHGPSAVRCRHDLTTATTPQFPEDHPMLQAQRLIHDVIEEGEAHFGIYAVEPVSVLTALSDLRAITARILGYADRDDLNNILPRDLLIAYDRALAQPTGSHRPRLVRKRPGFMAPAQAAITAAGVTAAIDVLNSGTIRDAGTALRRLVETIRRRGATVNPSTFGTWGRATSATLNAVQISALGPFLKPSDQLRYRTGAGRPHHRLPADGASSRHHRVPTLLWTTWALRLRPPNSLYLDTLRPTLSTMLLLTGTRRSLPNAAEILGAVTDAANTSRVLQMLEGDFHWPQILTALTRLADYLDTDNVPIDYHRRRRLDYRDLLPDDQWRHICRQTAFTTAHQRRARFARCLLFEKISTMPADRAPASFAINTPSRRDRLLHFAAHLTPDLATCLNEVAHDFLAHHGIRDEPTEWQPPATLLADLALPGDDPDLIDISVVHRLVHDRSRSLSDVAQQLGTTLDVVRYLLEQHPAPPSPLTARQARATGHLRVVTRAALPKDTLSHLYHDQRLTLREIGHRVGVSKKVIGDLLDDYGIARRQYRPTAIVVDRDWLYEQYITRRRTLTDLASETGTAPTTLARWARTHHIPIRPRGGASYNEVRLTLDQATTAPRVLQPALVGLAAWDRLRRFAAASNYPTIGIAAKALGLTKGILSTQIIRLEHDLGGQLLTRAERGRPMRLTPLGRKVITAIRKCASEDMTRD